ncbi:hypothetical protein DFH11DRAFT_1728247 [Phellopilus nigrolimitatus]|nr:hypothetical protein DFH11DRAFT_1728247 [Phellopilus nigrolimitatus]
MMQFPSDVLVTVYTAPLWSSPYARPACASDTATVPPPTAVSPVSPADNKTTAPTPATASTTVAPSSQASPGVVPRRGRPVHSHTPAPPPPAHTMSAIPSLSTMLSLLSLFTTVFALARVGAAAFSANQTHAQVLQHPPLHLAGAGGMSLAQAVRCGVAAERGKDGLKGADGVGVAAGYVGGHELVRMPWSSVHRQGLVFSPPSPFPDKQRPLSMAKLIMSRHNQRRPSRPPPTRRPPGLAPSPSPRSQLTEEVAVV